VQDVAKVVDLMWQPNHSCRCRFGLYLERLERRDLLNGSWRNSDLPCDVDASELVSPIDALLVINALNIGGARPVASLMPAATDGFVDVSGDEWISPLDALLVINALNSAGPAPSVVGSALPADDPNFNRVVLQDAASILGQTSVGSRIRVRRVQQSLPLGELPIVAQGMADSVGRFSVLLGLDLGANRFTIETRDQIGRLATSEVTLYRGDIVADWNATVLNAIRDWTGVSSDPYPNRIVPSPPPVAAKNLAMVHLAMFDAGNAVDGRFAPYLSGLPQDAGASSVAAMATAAHRVASQLYSDRDELPVWDATLAASLAHLPEGDAKTRGIRLGEEVATRLLTARANDGSRSASSYSPSSEPGHWNRPSPDFTPPLVPHWRAVTPFALREIATYRPPAPPTLESSEYAAAVDEVMRLGKLGSTDRTTEQTDIAKFWSDGAGTATPPGHWNRIATDVLMTDGRDLLDHARTLALLNLALADAAIAAWDAKYQYDVWRPMDAIRRAAEDGNSATMADSDWSPLLKTPAHPSFVSGHSTFSAAAATVLTSIYGSDKAFSSSTDPQSGLTQRPLAPELIKTRSYPSFWHAAEEAGMSRIYGGIHYAFDNTAGLDLGRAVGETVIGSWLQETPTSDNGNS
jgi:membrane-associated phospholipid phosphatase